jgi:hypothetical protein
LKRRDEIVAVCRRAGVPDRAAPQPSVTVTAPCRDRVDRGLPPLAGLRIDFQAPASDFQVAPTGFECVFPDRRALLPANQRLAAC